MNSNLNDLIRQEAPWRAHFDAFQKKFPMLVDNAVVVISGDSFGAVEQVSGQIEAQLRLHPEFFTEIYSPANDDFFRDNALLYLEVDQLDAVVTKIAQAQPILAAVVNNASFSELIGVLEQAYDNDIEGGQAADLLLEKIVGAGERVVKGEPARVHWVDEFLNDDKRQIRTLFFKGVADFTRSLPNERAIIEARRIIQALSVDASVSIGLTGEVVLAHEEIEAAFAGVKIAGYVSIVLLLGILAIGVRSLTLILATFVMLFVGTIWTSAWAMASIGEFNTLSIVFLVMFFGLGVDFAIHFCLCYQESLQGDKSLALAASVKKIGGAIVLCTATTAVGFLSFTPTDYRGLADLGVISAGGMVVACFLTFTLIPAFLSVVGKARQRPRKVTETAGLISWLTTNRISVVVAALIMVVGFGIYAKAAYFDYSVLALRDNSSGSMVALRELNREGQVTNYSLNIVGTNREVDRERLQDLSSVRSILTLNKLIPDNQNEKRFVLEDLNFLLGDLLVQKPRQLPFDYPQTRLDFERFVNQMPPAALTGRLSAVLQELGNEANRFEAWESGVIEPLLVELAWLGRAIAPGQIEADDLPPELLRRFVTAEGEELVVVIPERDVANVEALSEFVRQVTEVQAGATGRPAIEWGVGAIVKNAFIDSLLFALIGVFFILLITLRKITDSLLIVFPLILTAICTLGVSVLVDVPLNMANVLVLPLIFGLGVDNGLHVVERFRKTGSVAGLMSSSTPKAVVLSTLTTIGTFAALMLSPHQGTASIGFLLTLAISFLLLFTVLLLPALLSFSE